MYSQGISPLSHLSSLPCFATKFRQFEKLLQYQRCHFWQSFSDHCLKMAAFTSKFFPLISYRKIYQETSSKHYGFGQVFIFSSMYSFFPL
uniref:Ovule protein n=1 Tax=Panagrolaimus sp. JU765 TaxID=591449 RepID=A0AC34QN74_9BILA